MFEVVSEALQDGTIVKLGEMGNLRMSLSSEGRDKAEEVNATAIRGSSIIFYPDPKQRASLLSMKYQKQ